MLNSLKLAFVAVGLASSSMASAVTLIGGDTRVAFGEIIESLSPSLLGTASLISAAPLTVNFGITGGMLDGSLAGMIRHDGSGVSLTNGTNVVELSNFVIDTTAMTLFGDVVLNNMAVGTGLDLFSFDLTTVTVPQLLDLSNPMLALRLTDTSTGALNAAFGASLTTGTVIGLAATAPLASAVPEAQTWVMLLFGFGMAGVAVRRQIRRSEPVATF